MVSMKFYMLGLTLLLEQAQITWLLSLAQQQEFNPYWLFLKSNCLNRPVIHIHLFTDIIYSVTLFCLSERHDSSRSTYFPISAYLSYFFFNHLYLAMDIYNLFSLLNVFTRQLNSSQRTFKPEISGKVFFCKIPCLTL